LRIISPRECAAGTSRHEIRHQQGWLYERNSIHVAPRRKHWPDWVDNRGVSDGSEIVTPERLRHSCLGKENASSEEQARAKRRKD
jgi:hypothetical protein